MPETRIDELKSWILIFGDAPKVVKAYTMYSPRNIFWTHHETILEISNGSYIRICFESDGFVVSVHSTFSSAQNYKADKPVEIYDTSRSIKNIFEHLIEVSGRSFSHWKWNSKHYSSELKRWLMEAE